MKIAVIARMLRREKIEGIGMFARETLLRITQQHPEHEFIFLFDRRYDEEFIFSGNVKPVILPIASGIPNFLKAARHPIQIAYWHQVVLKKFLKEQRPEILVSPDGSIPLHSLVATLPVIHDINFEHFPQDLPFSFRQYYRYYFPRMAREATRIVTVSEFSKSDIIKHYKVAPDKIDVVYNAVDDDFRPLEESKVASVRKQYSNGAPYFLFVGSIHQRKNIEGMIEAYNSFRKTHDSNAKFIFAGARRWWNKNMEDKLNKSPDKNDILFTGRMTDEQLKELIGGAFALVLVSKFEGFGIPIIEAMKCGVPVITSDVTAMPEIAGSAALLVNPFSTDSISEAMNRLHYDGILRHSLISKGIERAKKFTWDKSAARLWKSIVHTMEK